jgi:hypothetical protein
MPGVEKPTISGASLRLNREGCLHVGMEAAIILDGAGLLQNQGAVLLGRQHYIPIAVARGRGVGEDVLVDPFNRVADLRGDLRRRDHQIFHRDLNGRGTRRDGRRER